jgi:hypothetical protein
MVEAASGAAGSHGEASCPWAPPRVAAAKGVLQPEPPLLWHVLAEFSAGGEVKHETVISGASMMGNAAG